MNRFNEKIKQPESYIWPARPIIALVHLLLEKTLVQCLRLILTVSDEKLGIPTN